MTDDATAATTAQTTKQEPNAVAGSAKRAAEGIDANIVHLLWRNAVADCDCRLPAAASRSVCISTRHGSEVSQNGNMYADVTEAEAAPDPKRHKMEMTAAAGDVATDGIADTAAAANEPSAAQEPDVAAADTAAADTDVDAIEPSEDAEGGKAAAKASQPSEPTVLAFRCR